MLVAQEFTAPPVEWWHLSPILALVSGALLLLVLGALTPTWPRGAYAWLTALTAFVAGGLAMFQWDAIDDDGPATLLSGALAFVLAVVAQAPALAAILAHRLQDLADYPRLQGWIDDREHHLHAASEVARHPIGARALHLFRAAILEVEDARVL